MKNGLRSGDLFALLVLAPAVMALRWPTLLAEASRGSGIGPETGRAVQEKMAAAMEGMAAAQMSFAFAGARMAASMLTGSFQPRQTLSVPAGALAAAMAPAARRVRANHRRLSRKALSA